MTDNLELSREHPSPLLPGERMDIDDPRNIGVPRVSIDWNRTCWWWRPMAATLPVAWRLSHLLLAGLGIAVTWLYVGFITYLFSQEDSTQRVLELSIFESLPRLDQIPSVASSPKLGLLHVWSGFWAPLQSWFESSDLRSACFALAYYLGLLAIWSLVGAALMRRSLVELGTGLTADWKTTIRIALQRWQSVLWAISMPVCAIAMICLFPFLFGVLFLIPFVGGWVAGLMLVPCSVLGLGIGWAAAITLLGFPLSISAIVAETRADAFDGLSRSAAYIFQRPTVLILLIAAFEILSRLATALFALILSVGTGIFSSAFFASAGIESSDGSVGVPLRLVAFALTTVPMWMVASFQMSYFWTAMSAVYLTLRKIVDGSELDSLERVQPDAPNPSSPLQPVPTQAT